MIYSAVNRRTDTIKVEVETRATFGKPGFVIIGLPSRVIDESRERITASLLQSGVRIKPQKTVVNLAPADISKKSSGLELAIAVSILQLYGLLHFDTSESLFLGELSLSGHLRKVQGLLAIVLSAAALGIKKIYYPAANNAELPDLPQLEFYPLQSLSDLLQVVKGRQLPRFVPSSSLPSITVEPLLDFSDLGQIIGQEEAKQALCIAAAGRHNLLYIGEPGAGKTMLARCLPSLLPDLSEVEFLELNKIYSLSGLLQHGLLQHRPFRSPHQSCTQLALIGGGSAAHFGEISLAHTGVLFLDEFAEFRPQLLELLRTPLESGYIDLSRGGEHWRYPARFILLAASNPCPCGYLLSQRKQCRCSVSEINRYKARFSGPLLDRFDLLLHLESASPHHRVNSMTTISEWNQTQAKERVIVAVKRQAQRYRKLGLAFNGDLPSRLLSEFCPLAPAATTALATFADKQQLSTRQYFKLHRVAQTLADLDQAQQIHVDHVLAALHFRESF